VDRGGRNGGRRGRANHGFREAEAPRGVTLGLNRLLRSKRNAKQDSAREDLRDEVVDGDAGVLWHRGKVEVRAPREFRDFFAKVAERGEDVARVGRGGEEDGKVQSALPVSSQRVN